MCPEEISKSCFNVKQCNERIKNTVHETLFRIADTLGNIRTVWTKSESLIKESNMSSLINAQIKPFKAEAYHNGQFVTVTDNDLKGKWAIVFFYPADFTFVCPTELGDLADHYEEFKKMGVEIYSVSTDTHFVHKAWHDASDTIKKIQFPMVGDPTGRISRDFNVMIEEEGVALRGTFVINPEGQIKLCEIHDLGIGRSAKELIRKVQAAQYVATHKGQVCPASWQPGSETLAPSLDLVGKI